MISLYEFEEKYKDILEDMEEWAFIRLQVGFYLKNLDNTQLVTKKRVWKEGLKSLYIIKTIFYGFKNWFGKYEYLFFSYSEQRKYINDKYKNKFMDDLIEKSDKKSLLLERKNSIRYKNIYTKHIVGEEIIYLLARFISFFINKKNDNKKMEYILKQSNIDINYKKEINRFFALELIYSLILKIYRPKKVFITCYYCRLPLVKACHNLNIKVIDVQHGVISKEHFGYISKIKIYKRYIADELLSFGYNELELENMIIHNVYPIGSYYLSYLQKKFKFNKKLMEIKKDYKYCIGVSMQDQEWEYRAMIDFLNKLAIKYQNILFLIIPRRRDIEKIKQKNIVVIDFLDCYNIVMHCNIHMTLYSSCALEAPSMGIPNILVDEKKHMATNYYRDLLSDYHTKIISTIDEFYNALMELVDLNSEQIKEKNSNIFVSNYNHRLLAFFNKGYNSEGK